MPPSTATISGTVTRSGELEDDGVGDLWVLVARDIVVIDELISAEILATDLIEGIDMSAEDASENYRITGVPMGTHAIVAILDEQQIGNPYPSDDDLLSLAGRAGVIQIEVDESEETKNLVLSASWPLF